MNEHEETQVNDEKRLEAANESAIICFVFALIALLLLCTVVLWVVPFLLSIGFGIHALVKKTNKYAFISIGLAFDGILALVVIPIMIICFWGLINFSSHYVREVSTSPMGTYQIDVINNDDGALGGSNCLVMEWKPKFVDFSIAGDEYPKRSVRITEGSGGWDTDYDFTWASDDVVYVIIRKFFPDSFRIMRAELSEGSYSAVEGKVSLDREGSYFDDFEIDGDKVYFVCYLNITNTFDEPVEIILKASSVADENALLASAKMVAVDEDGNEMVFTVPAGSTELFRVTFCGDKGPADTKADRELPSAFYLQPVSYYSD